MLVAAGSGRRMGGEKKQFASLAGTPVLVRALWPFAAQPGLGRAVVVLAAEDLARGREVLDGRAGRLELVFTEGGATRQESVRRGLAALGPLAGGRPEVVLVHDAARPLASAALVRRVRETAATGEGAVPSVPVSDTLKRADAGGLRTVSRAGLHAAQTPQAFPHAMIAEAHERALAEGLQATDDASLCEHYGFPVRLVEGEVTNLKLTTPADWALAEGLLAAREGAAPGQRLAMRTGLGYDVHRLEEGRPCVLGGVRIESARGPAGHSDGDVVAHAVMDALLGAAGEADIGHRFPSGDPRFAGADSLVLLAEVAAAVRARHEIVFVDVVVVAEAPRLGPHVPAMRARLAGALGLAPTSVNVKATTAEGLGALGRGEGIAAQAVATLALRA